MIQIDGHLVLPDRPNDLLTVGELLIDMISTEYNEQSDCSTYQRYFGGSPSNIAMNVTRLGIKSQVASAVGQDGFGDFLMRQLELAGLTTDCLQRVGAATSMVVVNKSQGTPVPIFYRGADAQLAYTEELEQALASSKILHFSCWPLSVMPVRDTLQRVLETAEQNQVLICFDPNYHPMVWQQGEDGTELVKAVIGRSAIIKPSEDDAERLFGVDSPERQVEKFLKLGAKLVIMTLGKDGALITDGTTQLRMPTLATEVVDTTGAGDAFWSGFYSGVVKGRTIRQALQLGFAVSAYKLKYTGAVVPLPTLEDIENKYGLQEV